MLLGFYDLGVETGGPDGRRRNEPGHSEIDYRVLEDLIMKMLSYDPDERITPFQAVEHPFFQQSHNAEVQTEASGAASGAASSAGGSASGAAAGAQP